MNKTGIEYLDYTWNPIAMRCTPISEACDNCWHLRTADRLVANPKIDREIRGSYRGDIGPKLIGYRLEEPRKIKKPSIIGVQFMGDLFHESIPFEWLDSIWDIFFECGAVAPHGGPNHTFVVLTKRHERMLEFSKWMNDARGRRTDYPNVWWGVTVESDRHYDRIETLKSIPAAKHFVSFEPLLSSIDPIESGCVSWGPFGGGGESGPVEYDGGANIDLAIVGAETGTGKRPMELDWARHIRDWCGAFGISFFFKKDSAGRHELDGRVWEELPSVRG